MKPRGVRRVNYKELIESKGIKKCFVAEQLGVSRQFMYQCLNGKKKFPQHRLVVLHRILGLN